MKNTNKKLVIAVIALAVALACTLGIVAAWLYDTTTPIVNTFTVGNVSIELHEFAWDKSLNEGAGGRGDDVGTAQSYTSIKPNDVLIKDAELTVKANSEACYLYIKVTPANNTVNTKQILSWAMDAGWTQLVDGESNAVAGVFYREVAKDDEDQVFGIIANDQVTVNSELTSADFEAIVAADPLTITLTGYAIQQEAGTAYAAWTAAGF